MTIDGTRARESFSEGANCAEAVLAVFGGDGTPTAGSGFTQGLGGSGCVCGALAAGVMAISAGVAAEGLEPAASREQAEALAKALHDRFRARWGSTCCRVLKRGQTQGSDAWTAHCAEIVESTAEMTRELLASRPRTRAWAPRDMADASRRTAGDALALTAVGALLAVAAGGKAAAFVLVAAVAGLLAGAVIESRGQRARRAGRVVRAVGTAGAALLGIVAALAPGVPAAAVASLFGGSATAVAARTIIACLAVVAALFRAFDIKRYR